MRITRVQWLVGVTTFLTAVIAVVTNIATLDVPPWLKANAWVFWPVLVILVILLIVVSMVAAGSPHKSLSLDTHKLDRFVGIVSNAEQITGIDPTLDKDERWAEKFAEWEQVTEELSTAIGVTATQVDIQLSKAAEYPARLLVRLAKAIIPALSRYGEQGQLVRAATVAYIAAKGLKDWDNAAQMAYNVSLKLYQRQEYSEAKEWVDRTEQSLNYNSGTQSSQDHLQMMLLETKGLIERDFTGNRNSAKEHFDAALRLATKLHDNSKQAQILAHLALLQELDGHNNEAMTLYSQSLASAPNYSDPELKLECYDKLARLAVVQGQDDRAYQLAKEQLILAKESLRRIHESKAHERIGWYMYKQSNFKEAYYHARQALSIEEEIKGDRINSLRVFLITIADKALQ